MAEPNQAIKQLWQIIDTAPSSVLELRAIDPHRKQPPVTKHFRVTSCGSVKVCRTAFETHALRLNVGGYNCYVGMNPINPEFQGKAATDVDITCRKLLLIDIDRAATAKEPATDAEVDAARETADRIVDYIGNMGIDDPIRTMSGNGHHIYYKLPEFPNNEVSTRAVESFLKKLAIKFNNEAVKIDTTVSNASRITKVVGTIARKGLEAENRPYRMSVIYEK